MTQSDKWKTNPNHLDPNKRQRKEVTQYFAFKDALVLQANKMKFELKTTLDAVYFTPMPDSWSKKKKERMNGFPCKVKPDTDNITKGIKDALKKSDSEVWFEKAEHRYAYHGSIIIFE
jgi:Holliday junction resolvase RusA-like endonuclease